ncbi:MAG: GlsB/YeaQ/YmgE family stress response membrane protein [Bacteroidales bacterium]|nr:GlsB/YeaQ/YmgE family stress response membrane protein [Bacteroidales bacterium]
MGKGMGLLLCIIVGVIGGFLGSWVFSLLGLSASGSFWGQLLVGTVGAVLLLLVLSLFRRKK